MDHFLNAVSLDLDHEQFALASAAEEVDLDFGSQAMTTQSKKADQEVEEVVEELLDIVSLVALGPIVGEQ